MIQDNDECLVRFSRSLRRVVVAKAKGSRTWSKRVKFDIKDRVAGAGWRGRVFVWVMGYGLGAVVSHTTSSALGVLPGFILMIVTDGSQLPCPNCHARLSSVKWECCPWCGHELTGYR